MHKLCHHSCSPGCSQIVKKKVFSWTLLHFLFHICKRWNVPFKNNFINVWLIEEKRMYFSVWFHFKVSSLLFFTLNTLISHVFYVWWSWCCFVKFESVWRWMITCGNSCLDFTDFKCLVFFKISPDISLKLIRNCTRNNLRIFFTQACWFYEQNIWACLVQTVLTGFIFIHINWVKSFILIWCLFSVLFQYWASSPHIKFSNSYVCVL